MTVLTCQLGHLSELPIERAIRERNGIDSFSDHLGSLFPTLCLNYQYNKIVLIIIKPRSFSLNSDPEKFTIRTWGKSASTLASWLWTTSSVSRRTPTTSRSHRKSDRLASILANELVRICKHPLLYNDTLQFLFHKLDKSCLMISLVPNNKEYLFFLQETIFSQHR